MCLINHMPCNMCLLMFCLCIFSGHLMTSLIFWCDRYNLYPYWKAVKAISSKSLTHMTISFDALVCVPEYILTDYNLWEHFLLHYVSLSPLKFKMKYISMCVLEYKLSLFFGLLTYRKSKRCTAALNLEKWRNMKRKHQVGVVCAKERRKKGEAVPLLPLIWYVPTCKS